MNATPSRLLPLLVGLAVMALAPPSAAGADPIADAQRELDQARQEAHEAARRYESSIAERFRAEAEIATLEATIPALRQRVVTLRENLSERAAALYRLSEDGANFERVDDPGVTDPARRVELTESALRHDEELARELDATSRQLAEHEETLRLRTAELDALVPRLEQEKAAFDAKVLAAQRALEKAFAIGAARARGETPVMGASVLTAGEIAAWYSSTSGRQRLPGGVPIEELAALYIEEGLAVGVRGDIAFAQSIVETGSFSATGPNNFAGLGACDSCTSMRSFPTPRDGVRAQVQHLRNYADAASRADQLGFAPSPYWYGADPTTAAANFNGFFAKGWAPTWEEMGAGNWATDPGYAGKVLAVYDRMLGLGTG